MGANRFHRHPRPTEKEREYFRKLADGVRAKREQIMNQTKSKGDFMEGLLPEGFDTVEGGRREFAGYVRWADGVIVQGVIKEIFTWVDKDDKERETIVLQVTMPHALTYTDDEGEEHEAADGTTVAMDMKYGLQPLREKVGSEVYIACLGKEEIGRGKSVINFNIGVKKGKRK